MERKRIKYLFQISGIFALAGNICFYKNSTGIACALFGVIVAGILFYVSKRRGIRCNRWQLFYGISGIILSIIPTLMANEFCMAVGRALYIIILIKWVVSIYFNVDKLEFVRNISILLSFILEGIGQILAPFSDIQILLGKEKKDKMAYGDVKIQDNQQADARKNSKFSQIIIGIIIAIPLLIIVLSLLLSADVIFRKAILDVFIKSILGIDNVISVIKWFIMLGLTFLAVYGCGKGLISNRIKTEPVVQQKADNVIGITFTSIFATIYVLFSLIQVIALLNTNGSMLPNGVTYSEYARQGFFQLLIVCIINVVMILICKLKFQDGKWLKRILTIISVCTYVMVGSSAYRMILYIHCYQLTFLRILVLWTLVVIAVIMGFVISFIYKEHIPLFEYILVSVTVLFVGFALMLPDRIIAKYNIAHFDEQNNHDIYYLTHNISEDGADVILSGVNDEEYEEYLYFYCDRIIRNYEKECGDDIRAFNVSRYLAYKEAKEYVKDKE